MLKKKIKLYYKTNVRNFFKFIYGKVLLPKKSTKIPIKLSTINNLKFKTFLGKKYKFYSIDKARIYTDNNENVAIIKNNFLVPKTSYQQVNGILKNEKFNSTLHYGTPSFLKKYSGTVLNLAQGGSGNNYFHFFFDIIPKIFLFKSNQKNFEKIDYFYFSNLKKWQIEIFKIAGIKKKFIDSQKYNHIFADKVITLDHPWYYKGNIQYQLKIIPQWIIHLNKKIFLNKSKKINCKKNIFLDRSSSNYNHCQIENMNGINELIFKNNFGVYKPETLEFEKQIYLFKNASIVLGAHGAAFTNIIFCRPKTKIIELITSDHPNRKCEMICKVLNLRYFRINTKVNNSDKNFPYKIVLEKKHLKLIDKIINL